MLGLWWMTLAAMAFRPDPAVYIGTEPSRLFRFHKEQQAKLRHAPRWQGFVRTDGVGWQARFDERTGGVVRAWGPGIPMGDLSDLASVEHAVRQFFSAHEQLLGVSLNALKIGRSGHVAETDTWLVQFDEWVPGSDIQVWRAGLKVRIKQGRLVMFGIDTHPNVGSMSVTPTIDSKRASSIAMDSGPAGNSKHTDESIRLMVLPVDNGHSLEPVLAWEVRSKTERPKGHWVSFVDAHTGNLINVHNEVRFGSGVLYGEHDVRTVNGEMEVSPMFGMRLSTEEAVSFSDEEGAWSLDVDETIQADFSGEHIRIRNRDDANAKVEASDGEVILTSADASQAELSAFAFQNQIRDWAIQYAPDLSLIDGRMNVYVNIDEVCNAYFDGDLNFMRAGSGCNNTGRIADVNYHEWGHGFHYYSLQSGEFDGAMSEGIADVVAFLNTGDSTIAPFFFESGEGIRNVERDRVYPDDWVNEVHEDGLIFGGAVWDLWSLLEEEMGEDQAYETVNHLLVQAVKAGPTTPEAFDEFILADDDNGDLGDGTPNSCTIIEAFARHGLGPGGDGGLYHLIHDPVGNQAANQAIPLAVEAVNMAPECTDASIQDAEVVFSTDGGDSWQSVSLAGDEDNMEGTLPAQPEGTVVSYYFSADTGEERTAQTPRGGKINPFTFFVGELTELYCEDFESGDGGYTHSLVSGDWEEGADDWQWGTPIGMGRDPDFAFSGEHVWGNDLGGGQYNGEYQNDKHNRLQSSLIDVFGQTELVLKYRRWLNVEDGFYDQANILANGTVVWTNHATSQSNGDEHHQDDQWIEHVVPISLAKGEDLTLGWEISSDRGLSMGGWNIDDVCIYGVGSFDPDSQSGDDDDGNAPQVGFPRGDGWVVEGEKVGCTCSNGGRMGQMGWFGLLLTGLLAAVRRRER